MPLSIDEASVRAYAIMKKFKIPITEENCQWVVNTLTGDQTTDYVVCVLSGDEVDEK